MHVSALFVSRRMRVSLSSLLSPCVSVGGGDWTARLKTSVRARKLSGQLLESVDRLPLSWSRMWQLQQQHDLLQTERQRLPKLITAEPSDSQLLVELRGRGVQLRKSSDALLEEINDVEDAVFAVLAELPNSLHEKTPLEQDSVSELCDVPAAMQQVCAPATVATFGHDGGVYLSDAAALCELALLEHASVVLETAGCTRITCPDTVKSAVLEACGGLHAASVRIDSDAVHLTGGASLPAVCAAFCRSQLPSGALPLRLFSAGRQYQPRRPPAESSGAALLVEPLQASVVRHVTLCSGAQADDEFQRSLGLLQQLLVGLGLQCRRRQVAAPALVQTEMRRVQLEVWSPALRRHLPVAHVAQHGDYIGRRLHVVHGPTRSSRAVHVIDGLAVHVPHVLAALLAARGDTDLVVDRYPAVLQQYYTL